MFWTRSWMTWCLPRYSLPWIKNSKAEWIFKAASERIYNVPDGNISKEKAFPWETALETWWIWWVCWVYRQDDTHGKVKQYGLTYTQAMVNPGSGDVFHHEAKLKLVNCRKQALECSGLCRLSYWWSFWDLTESMNDAEEIAKTVCYGCGRALLVPKGFVPLS